MTELPPALRLLDQAPAHIDARVTLTYDQRLIRRKRLQTEEGEGFLVDLPHVTNLDDFWGFELADGRTVAIEPAREEVLVVTGDLARLAWHIGNRHTPCEIHADHLVIRVDPVLEGMLRGLGAEVALSAQPFRPEGGAYGTGRPMGHTHDDTFGWHDHGDGQPHFHPPAPAVPFGHIKAR